MGGFLERFYMDSLQISSGIKRIEILDENKKVKGVIEFNPEDTGFANQFYSLIHEIHKFEQKHAALFENKELDKLGLPKNSPERISLFSEFDEYIRERVDSMFGDNAAEYVFGKTVTFSKFAQLVEGVTPYFSVVRKEKTDKYRAKKVSKKTSARTKAK